MTKIMISHMNQIRQAVILAAGIGSRLKSFTENKPKALMPIADEAAIVHIIRHLVSQGIHDIAINIHHHAEQIRQTLGNGSRFNANLHYSYEETLLDSGGGVRTAMDLLPDADLLAVYNADIISDIDLHRLSSLCPYRGCALALVDNPKHNQDGDFSLNGQHVIQKNMPNYTFTGVSVWHKETLLTRPAQQKFSLVELIQDDINAKQCLGVRHQGYWFDIGRPHDLFKAKRFLRERYA
ncbi:MAG: nucleotidyltransferase family protein [Ghiorsea sp.]|nr:nucleotidyltransferase family protein [Ghiorsea sp.]